MPLILGDQKVDHQFGLWLGGSESGSTTIGLFGNAVCMYRFMDQFFSSPSSLGVPRRSSNPILLALAPRWEMGASPHPAADQLLADA